jgi:predicted AlkP superfamily pyrophosphatase or phosphodiesterase
MRLAALAIASLVFISTTIRPAATDQEHHPKLVVMIVVDQMRADYVDRFQRDWTAGLKRLTTQGAWFRHAAYPYLNTLTCAGHATIATGAFPHLHGIMQNMWWDREKKSLVACSQDDTVKNVAYRSGTAVITGSNSARNLRLPTFADELRESGGSRIVTIALKERSAIMLAGHGGDAVTWLANTLDGWQTSSAFTEKPHPLVKAFLDVNPIDADYGKTWTRSLPADRYPEQDDQAEEAPPAGWTRIFPHQIKSSGEPDFDSRAQWERSPFADEYVGRFAAALAESFQLGKRDTIDLLGISFSSPDLIGHAFGPQSQEIHDTYIRLDRTIGTLFERLDHLVGPDQYIVALSADHGVSPIPEQRRKAGSDAGRFDVEHMTRVVEESIVRTLGPGNYVARWNGNDVYLEPGVYARLKVSPGALDGLMKEITRMPGVATVFHADQLRDATTARDARLRAAALSYVSGTSGDLLVSPKPGWVFGAGATTHGSANADDQRVPILLMGWGIRPGRYSQPATPADIAPTLAALCGIQMPAAEGRLLREAVLNTTKLASAAEP